MNTTNNKIALIAVLSILVVSTLGTPTKANAMDLSFFTSLFSKNNTKTEVQDDRAARLDAYFAKRNMPLEGHGQAFVATADKYGLDWRLLPAIGVRESSGGKHLLNNNPFGWGSCKIKFADFDEAIEEVAKNLSGSDEDTAKYYKNKTTYQILWAYNGTVIHSYPDEVIAIMNMF